MQTPTSANENYSQAVSVTTQAANPDSTTKEIANSIQSLSKQQLVNYQQLFSIFDKEDQGVIKVDDVQLYVRGLGHCPTQEELKDIIQKLDPNEQGIVEFKPLVELLINRKIQTNIEQQLIEAFEGIQNETGGHSDNGKSSMTSVTGAKKYLSEFGEGLSQSELEQFQEFIEENDLKQGIQFNFRDLTKILAYGYTE